MTDIRNAGGGRSSLRRLNLGIYGSGVGIGESEKQTGQEVVVGGWLAEWTAEWRNGGMAKPDMSDGRWAGWRRVQQ